MKQTEPRLAAEVAGWFEDADRIDTEEDAQHGADKRGDEMPDWAQNKQTAEPVIGNLKDRNGLRQCMARGLAKIGGEWSLACTPTTC